MTHDNVQPFKSYFTYGETKEEVHVAFCDHIANGTVKTATDPFNPALLSTREHTSSTINQLKIMYVANIY